MYINNYIARFDAFVPLRVAHVKIFQFLGAGWQRHPGYPVPKGNDIAFPGQCLWGTSPW